MIKKILRGLLCIFVMGLMAVPFSVNASENDGLSIVAVKCPMSEYSDFEGEDKYWACLDDYEFGNLPDSYYVNNNDDLDPGTVLLLMLNYSYGTNNNGVIALQSYFNYDASNWTSINDSAGELFFYADTGDFPSRGSRYDSTWGITITRPYEGMITFVAKDDNFYALDDDYTLGYLFLKLNETATPGTVLTLSQSDVAMSDRYNKNIENIETSGLMVNVYSGQSTDATLNSLSVKSDSTTYELSPEFTAGDKENQVYSTVVPNNITSIELSASVNDSNSTIVDSSDKLGTKSLDVGSNQFKFTVRAQYGNEVEYTVNVYRLSNDATLSSLSLTSEDISIGTFSSSTTTYSGSVLYAVTDTNVNATPTHEFAKVNSGTGLWNLSKYGTSSTDINTRDVIVHAENCDEKYKDVPGNSCSTETYTINVTRGDPSTNSYLSDLTVNNSTISGFDKTKEEYDLGQVSNATTSITIDGVVEDTGRANITSGTGSFDLDVGENTFDVVVTAEDKSTTTYTIKVYRVSNDTKLTSLSVTSSPTGTLSPGFTQSFTGDYTYSYDATVSSIIVTATANDTGKAYVTIADPANLDSSVRALNTATNTFDPSVTNVSVTVTAEDGTFQVYNIILTRSKSSDNTLSSLSLSEGTLSPDFTPNTRSYNATVDASVTRVDVTAIPNVSYAQVISITGNENLDFGSNTIEVVVKAEDNTETSYFVFLTRKEYDIATLSDLTVGGVTIEDFDSEDYEYTLDAVDFNTTSLEIGATPTNRYATVSGTGTISLKTGDNPIKVVVTSQDGKVEKTYTINVYREKNDDNSVHSLKVDGITPTLNEDGTYSVTLPNSKTTLTDSEVDVTVSSDATVEKDASINLSTTAVNEYTFKVIAENGDSETYTINVTRTKSNAATISRVTATVGSSSYYCLMDGGTSCTISVPVTTTSFVLDAIISDAATINPENGETYEMTSSDMSIGLIVTAEDGTIGNYTVKIERQKSSDSNLSDLTIDGTTVSGFSPTTQTYRVTVPGLTSAITVGATVADTTKASIVTDLSDPFDLEYGENTIEVVVKAEDTSTKTYTLIVTRSKNIDATLSDLTVNGVTIDGFEPGVYNYTLDPVDYNTTSLLIKATATDSEYAKVTGTGVIDLETGDNTITVTVTAHDTSYTKDYTITVKRAKNNDTGIKGIKVDGKDATYNSTTKNYEITVPNNVDKIDASNVEVSVNDPITNYDSLATYTVTSTNLTTTSTNEVPIIVKAEDGTEKTYKLIVTRTKSNVATLDSISVSDGSINGSFSPSFSSGILEYTVTLPVETTNFTVSAKETDPNSDILSGVGNYTMESSTMKVSIVVVSEDESVENTYVLNIERTKSTVNTLSGITLSAGTLSPTFSPSETRYTVNVEGSVESIDIGATLTDEKATIVSGEGSHDLDVGENTITIRVQSEAGAFLDYTIKVIRAPKTTSTLSDLKIDGVTIDDFSPDKTSYNLGTLDYSKTKLEIDATPTDSDATVSGNGSHNLSTGDGRIDVVVTAQDGKSTTTYSIYFTRSYNDDATLKILSVEDYTLEPNFTSSNTSYTLTVLETKDSLSPDEVTAIATDTNAKVEKQEEISLSTGTTTTYSITVTAEDKTTTKTYTIKVTRPESTDTTLSAINLTGATLSPSFDPSKTAYTITVPYGSTDFSIEAVPNVSTTIIAGNGDYTIDDEEITIYATSQSGTIETYKFTIVQALSNDATLSNLSVSGYPFDTRFSPTNLNYNIGNVPYGTTNLTVNATPNNISSKIEYYVDGVKQDSKTVSIPNVLGEKIITVKVIAADENATKSYNITYNLVSSDVAYLSKLEPSVGTIDFVKTTTYYEITVDNEIDTISFDIETEDENASITVNGDSFFTPKTITLSDLTVGNNTVSILVTAQDGKTKKTYNVVVKRLEKEPSSDANLSSLSVVDYSLDKTFNMDTLEYSIGEVPFDLTELTINATPNMGSSSISYLVNGVKQSSNKVTIPKEKGEGTITVQVTAEDGKTIKNYKINYEKNPSSNAYLSNLEVSNGTLTFNKNTLSYTVDVPNEVISIDVTATLEDEKAELKMNGAIYDSPHTLTLSSLNVGDNEVKIIVTAEDGTVLTYKVIINREEYIPKEITSNEYGHTIEDDYIKTVKLSTTGLEIKDQLDNENQYLEIWTSDESEQVNDTDPLATGMIVKLMINGKEEDRKIIVIKGDTNGDSEIDLFDAVLILNDYLERTPLEGAYLEAAYVSDDNELDLLDSVMILNHYLGRTLIH